MATNLNRKIRRKHAEVGKNRAIGMSIHKKVFYIACGLNRNT